MLTGPSKFLRWPSVRRHAPARVALATKLASSPVFKLNKLKLKLKLKPKLTLKLKLNKSKLRKIRRNGITIFR